MLQTTSKDFSHFRSGRECVSVESEYCLCFENVPMREMLTLNSMAYHEIRLILANLLYNFDLQLCKESENWNDQKTFLMWDKGPLYCKLSPRV